MVGLVIGGVLIVLAAGFLLLRSRFMKARQQRRATWINQAGVANVATVGGSSFAAAGFAATEKRCDIELEIGLLFHRRFLTIILSVHGPPVAAAPVLSEGARVKYTFIPSLLDELSISNGEGVVVLQEFDDGWALCKNSRGREGMVPLECLVFGAELPNGGDDGLARGDVRNSRRDSSWNIINRRV
ncbi:hypothetical protein C8J56DRAFT_466154 [Mycena floridula]|nr:hypothetical protein C8J56DRAFT_466154 [Mycena floridula]